MAHPDRFLLAGVMGWPVMHSRSPMLHNYWFKQHGLAGTYVPLAIRPEGLAAALRALHPLGFAGCNLTIPHKQQAMAIVDEVDALARSIGAISCVVARPDGALAGTNNDCYGFIQNVRQEQPGWRADAVAVAKKNLLPGEILDGEGGYTVVGRLMPAADSLAQGCLPLGLAHGWKLLRPVTAGQPVRWSDAAIDASSSAVRARREMEQAFGAPVRNAA